MKKKTKRILLATGILVVLGTVITVTLIVADMAFGLFGRIDRKIDSNPEDKMMGKVITAFYKEIYSDKWTKRGVKIYDKEYDAWLNAEDDEKIVKIKFELKNGLLDDSVLENISEIYKTVTPLIKEYMDSRYDSFSIEFYFVGLEICSGYHDGCIQIVCMNNCETIKLSIFDGNRMSLKAVAGMFPELNQIEFRAYGSLQYDSIEDIAGFDDLQMLDFGILLPEEDKEYILSLYPDCEIVEESYYKYKTEE